MPTIYLMRHGEAEMQAPSDAARQLTAYGQDYTTQIATQLAGIIVKHRSAAHHTAIPLILHSPYQRAKATAILIEDKLKASLDNVGAEAEERPRRIELLTTTPDSNPEECFKALSAYADQAVLLVSHMPLIAVLASLFEHGNIYQAHPFETSEIRVFTMDHWLAGSAEFKYRLL